MLECTNIIANLLTYYNWHNIQGTQTLSRFLTLFFPARSRSYPDQLWGDPLLNRRAFQAASTDV